MAVQTKTITVPTNGYSDVVDLTNKVEEILVEQDINTGIVSLFIPGSTAGLTTIEYEPGCVQDMKNALERIFPESDHYAHNARWGRILMAVGNSGVNFNSQCVSVFIGDIQVCKNGEGLTFDERKAKIILQKKEINVTIQFNDGNGSAHFWTCDLTKKYIDINAYYRT